MVITLQLVTGNFFQSKKLNKPWYMNDYWSVISEKKLEEMGKMHRITHSSIKNRGSALILLHVVHWVMNIIIINKSWPAIGCWSTKPRPLAVHAWSAADTSRLIGLGQMGLECALRTLELVRYRCTGRTKVTTWTRLVCVCCGVLQTVVACMINCNIL